MKLYLSLMMIGLLAVLKVSAQQQVVIKDSSVRSTNGVKEPAIVFVNTYNNICQITSTASSSSRSFYTYTDKGQLYDQTLQFFISSAGGFVNYSRFIYTYNEAGKTTGYVTQFWNASANNFYNVYKDSNLYDENQYKIKNFSQSWNDSSGTWTTSKQTDYYNNSKGEADSSVTNTYSQYDYTVKNYYGSYDSGNVRYRVLTFYTDSTGVIYNRTRTTYFHDSTNYIARDSTVYDNYAGGNSFVFYQADVTTKFYNADNQVSEKIFSIQSVSYNSITHVFSTYNNCLSVLPLTYINFSASQQRNNALLSWQTNNEMNTASFAIQKSADGEHFTTIGSVKAMGDSSHNYLYTDANAFVTTTPKVYYRLAETGKNGNVEYSKIISLNVTVNKGGIKISPNPVTNMIYVYCSANTNQALITINDMQGNIVYTTHRSMIAGNSVNIDVSAYAKGMYIITIQSTSYKQQQKIIKE